jgi:hypothetical protein
MPLSPKATSLIIQLSPKADSYLMRGGLW